MLPPIPTLMSFQTALPNSGGATKRPKRSARPTFIGQKVEVVLQVSRRQEAQRWWRQEVRRWWRQEVRRWWRQEGKTWGQL